MDEKMIEDITNVFDKKYTRPTLNTVMENEDKPKEGIENTDTKIPSDVASIILRHEDEIREVASKVIEIHDFIKNVESKIKKGEGSPLSKLFFKYFSDKEYVILGVVGLAIGAMCLVRDPVNILMSIVSGLFGLGTGRAMSKNDKDLE